MSTGNENQIFITSEFQTNLSNIFFPNRVGIEHTMGESQNAYLAATTVKPQTIREEQPMQTTPMVHSDTDSDSN